MQATTAQNVSPIHLLDSILVRIDLERLFKKQQPLEVELGSGDGSFLAEYASLNPGRNFIGIERLLGRIRKLEKKARRGGLENLRAIRVESSYFLQHLIPRNSVAALHVYFPDPWPKRRHRRHRLVNEAFPGLSKGALEPGGRVYLRTDNADYFEQMTSVFAGRLDFRPLETPETLKCLLTDFEREFQARGISTLRVAYELA